MTSLIFGGIALAHQGIVKHRRDKQRTKNYARWEDLRDDYDAQKKTQRETRSLDIQRTGNYFDNDHDVLTLRDQQEADDARMSWRPQESFGVRPQPTGRPSGQSISSSSSFGYEAPELRPQKTGLTWDEGLPPPLKVSRRSYEEDNNPYRVARSQSVQYDASRENSRTASPLSHPSSQRPGQVRPQAPHTVTAPASMHHLEPIHSHVPGGRMAELIEQGY